MPGSGKQLRDHCGRTGGKYLSSRSWTIPRAKDSHKRRQISALKAEIGSYAKAKIRGFSSVLEGLLQVVKDIVGQRRELEQVKRGRFLW